MTIALCNSCLRVREFQSYEEACQANCECGAENGDYVSTAYCPCPYCAGIATQLLATKDDQEKVRSVFESDAFEGKTNSDFSWTAHGGFVLAEKGEK
jgi:hypothetical protein